MSANSSSLPDLSSTSGFFTPTNVGNLASLAGTGLAAYNQQQAYQGLQGALNTIGPTQLQGFNMGGPGGMSSGYNPATGTSSIDLGSLNPAFSGFAGAAGTGSNAYDAGLPSALSGTALSTMPAALSTLGGAYGNYNAGMGAANAQLGSLGDFNTTYNNMLQAQYGQLAPQIQQQAFGLQNTLFGNGVADSTGAASGSLAAQNFGRGVGQAQSTAQLNAYQQALAQQNSAAQNYGSLSSSAGNILSNAFNNFGNTNQLISGLNTAGLNNATTAAQGAGALNTVGLNNYNAALQTGSAQATARNQSLFPYASVATSLYGNGGAPNASSAFANLLTGAGSSLSGNNSGLSSMYNQLFGGSGGSNVPAGALQGADSYSGLTGASGAPYFLDSGSAGAGGSAGSIATDAAGNPDWLSGFSSAGGQAAGDAGGAAASGAGAGDISSALGGSADTFNAGYGAATGGDAAAGAAGGGSSGSMAALASMWPAAVGIGGLYGMYRIFQNQGWSPASESNALNTSAQGAGQVANNLNNGSATAYGISNANAANALGLSSSDMSQLSQLMLTNPQAAEQLLGGYQGGGARNSSIYGTTKES